MKFRDTEAGTRKAWRPLRLSKVGNINELLLEGGGKGSPSPGDPGEDRKPPGNPQSEQG